MENFDGLDEFMYLLAYNKFRNDTRPLKWVPFHYFPGKYTALEISENIEVVVSVNDKKVLMIIVLPTIDIRRVTLVIPVL